MRSTGYRATADSGPIPDFVMRGGWDQQHGLRFAGDFAIPGTKGVDRLYEELRRLRAEVDKLKNPK